METASLSWRRRNLYCRLFYDDSWASQVRFISPIFLLFPIGIQFLQRKSDTIKQSFKKSFPLRPVLLVVIIHDFLFLSVIPVKYLGFTQLWFYTTLKRYTFWLPYHSRFTQLWFYTTLKHWQIGICFLFSFTQLWFYTTLKRQSFLLLRLWSFTQLWFYTTLKHNGVFIWHTNSFTQLWFYTTLKHRRCNFSH